MNRRQKAVIGAITVFMMICAGLFVYRTGAIPGLNAKVDASVEEDKKQAFSSIVKEGQIFDRDGSPITKMNEVSDKEIQSSDKNKELINSDIDQKGRMECLYEAYGSLIGYSSKIYGKSGLRLKYKDFLYTPEGDTEIYLTTQNGPQQYAYDLLGNNVGSIVVLENKTGKALVLAGRNDAELSYDVNEIDAHWKEYNKKSGFLEDQYLTCDAPGSVFKIVSTVMLSANGQSELIIDDTGEYNGVINAGGAAYGEIGLSDAFVKSVNTCYAEAIDKTGAKKLEETAKEFRIGQSMELDFGPMESKIDMGYYENAFTNEATAFGQGNTQLSPVHMALILSTVVNEGKMVKPYVIDHIITNGKISMISETEELTNDFEPEVMQEVKGYLHEAAKSYGFDEDEYGVIYAKTGTAEHDGTDLCHIYLAAANEDITAVISIRDTLMSSYDDLIPMMKKLLTYMIYNTD